MWVDRDHLADVDQLEQAQATLASLVIRDKRLGPVEQLRHIFLLQPRERTGLPEKVLKS